MENFNTLQISFCHMSGTEWICKKLTHDCPQDAKLSSAQIQTPHTFSHTPRDGSSQKPTHLHQATDLTHSVQRV